jgi:hypothetical protein
MQRHDHSVLVLCNERSRRRRGPVKGKSSPDTTFFRKIETSVLAGGIIAGILKAGAAN